MMHSADCTSNVCFARSRFTGKERDTESENDYFEARYYSSLTGRFMSPDWSAKEEPVPYAKLDNPQTLNLYAYVGNNPMTRVDEDGHVNPCELGACGMGPKIVEGMAKIIGLAHPETIDLATPKAPGVPGEMKTLVSLANDVSDLRRKEFCASRGLSIHTPDVWRRTARRLGIEKDRSGRVG
jgi:RHS repeat-associated protein